MDDKENNQTLLKQILKTEAGSIERINGLENFVNKFSDILNIGEHLDKDNIDQCKIILKDYLLSVEVENQTEELLLALKTLRILSRTKHKYTFTSDILDYLCKLLNLDENEGFKSNAQSEEILKCILNILLTSDVDRHFYEKKHPHKLVDALKSNTYDDSIVAVVMKILFAVLRPTQTNSDVIAEMTEYGVLDVVVKYLNIYVDRLYFDNDYMLIEFSPINEAIKIMICVLLDKGPLGKNDVEGIKRTIKGDGVDILCPLLRVLHTNLDNFDQGGGMDLSSKLFDMKLNVAAALANVPPKLAYLLKMMDFRKRNNELSVFTPTETQEEEILGLFINDLCNLLEVLLDGSDQEQGKSSTMLLLFLTSLAKGVQLAREVLLSRLFPGLDMFALETVSFSMDSPLYEHGCIGSVLIKNMTIGDTVLKYWSTELLFQICHEDGKLLVNLTGFGNAAGLLAMRNLFGMGRHLSE